MEKELNLGNQISKYYQSFSGTDTLVFMLMPGRNPVVLGSITTVSYSAYRTKQPVINLGRTNINGVTRGSRIFAGTMIFTLINLVKCIKLLTFKTSCLAIHIFNYNIKYFT